MPPKLVSDDGKHVVIRPLAYVRERDLARYAEVMAFPIIPCTLCGSQENLQRKQVAGMLRDWQKHYPGRAESIFNALSNVVTTHLLDRSLQDFAAIRASGTVVSEAISRFDDDLPCPRALAACALRRVTRISMNARFAIPARRRPSSRHALWAVRGASRSRGAR